MAAGAPPSVSRRICVFASSARASTTAAPVSAAACAHLDIACDNFAVQEGGLVGRPVMEDIFPVQLPYEAGSLLPPESHRQKGW